MKSKLKNQNKKNLKCYLSMKTLNFLIFFFIKKKKKEKRKSKKKMNKKIVKN